MKKRICLLLVLSLFMMTSCRRTETPTGQTPADVPSEPAVVKYSITYNNKGHGTQPSSLTEVTALPAELPVLTAEGWTFGGWFTDEACTKAAVAGSTLTSNVTLYAKWTEVVAAPVTYSVTYNINGHGTEPSSLTEVTALPAELPVLTAEGWTFEGWYTDEACTEAAIAGSALTGNVTLYAKWTEVVLEEPKVEVIKQGESFELEALESKEINLTEYFSYAGSKYSYEVETENKEFVEVELLNNKLTVFAVAKGVEKVTVKLGDKTIEFTFTVTVEGEVVLPEFEIVNVSYDLNDEDSMAVILAPTEANGYTEFTYALKSASDGVTISGNTLTVDINSVCEKTVVVVCTLSEELSVEFNVNIKVYKTINVLNGSFDKGLEGWTLDGNIGEISEEAVFWNQDFAVNNVGKYFTGSKLEGEKGTLISNLFKLEGTGYITFMLGASGNDECYIKIVDENNNVLAVYRNTEFKDMQDEHHDLSFEEQRELIGTEINTLNLIKYKADLSAHLGKMIKIVVVDNATANFGFVSLDEVNCYNVEVPGAEYVLAENQLPDFAEANQLIANKVTAQGDYTKASYDAYLEAINVLTEGVTNAYIVPSVLEELVEAVKTKYEALTLRKIEVSEEKTEFLVITGNKLEINYADYFDENELSSVTYTYTVDEEYDEALDEANGVVTFDSTGLELISYEITINALYKGEVSKSVTLNVKVIAEPTVTVKQEKLVFNYDLYGRTSNVETFDLSENIEIVGDLEVTYSINEQLVNQNYEVNLSVGQITATVVVKYNYNGEKSVSYDVEINVVDTAEYRVENGSFDKELDGWTLVGNIGGISEKDKFWDDGYPVNNVGKYFCGELGNEAETGTLTSSLFKLNDTGYITFMLGSAGNENCYIKVVDEDDNILAIYRNTEFRDFPAGEIEDKNALIGNQVNTLNLVKYKADLSVHKGKMVKVVAVDNGGAPFGFISIDELITYYTEVPGDEYVKAVNQLADLQEAKELIASKVTEQGDYTKASFDAYVEAVDVLTTAIVNESIKQAEVDKLVNAVKTAYDGLTYREIIVNNVEKTYVVITGESKEFTYATFFNENELSSVAYNFVVDETLKELVCESEGVITFNTTDLELGEYTLTLSAKYPETEMVTVNLTIKVVPNQSVTVKNDKLEYSFDYYEHKTVQFDLSQNIEIIGGLEVTYKIGGQPVNVNYSVNLAAGLETGKIEATIVVEYTYIEEQKSVSYDVLINVTDTTENRLHNGGFENGLEGWTKVGNIGDVSTDTHYWLNDPESAEGFEFGMDGSKMFSAYAPNVQESALGTLTSSKFTIGGSGFITYKIGAAKNSDKVRLEVIEASTGNILKAFGNQNWAERTADKKSGCTLLAYKANLSDLKDKEVYIRVVDNAIGDFGLFFLDSVVTYYEAEPTEEFVMAEPLNITGNIYQLYNGSFQLGNLNGWTKDGKIGDVNDASTYWAENIPFNKENTDIYFFNAYYPGAEEGATGSLTSSIFTVGGSGFITYRIGGAKNIEQVKMQVIDASNGQIIKVLGNPNWYEDETVKGCTMLAYLVDLSDLIGRQVYIRVVDNAINDYGLFFLDAVNTYYENKPATEGYYLVYADAYQVCNGDFETGTLVGWNLVEGEIPGEVLAGDKYFNGNSVNKDGNYSFQAVEIQGSGYNTEYRMGIIRSNTFILKENSLFSFKLSGGNHPGKEGIRVVNALTGEVLAVFTNDQPAEGINEPNGQLVQYHYQFTNEEAITCYIEIFDNEPTAGWRLVGVDSLKVNVKSSVEGSKAANNIK